MFPLPGSCPIAERNEIISSPNGGWFLTFDGDGDLHLVNPITGRSIYLPSFPFKKTPLLMKSLPLKRTPAEVVGARIFVMEKILSADLVAFLAPNNEGLSVFKLGMGENSWKTIQTHRPYCPFADFVFHDQRFYVISWGVQYGVLSIFDGESFDHVADIPLVSEQWELAGYDYLVISPGEDLLMLRRTPYWKKGDRFLIFVLKFAGGVYTWVMVKNWQNTTFLYKIVGAVQFNSSMILDCAKIIRRL